MSDLLNEYTRVKDCIYKEELYSVRDNGAVMRHSREGKRIRKDDCVWTFGKHNRKTGYMEISGQRVHRIVAFAFLGNPPTEQHVVDHIDTNRCNNRPENLRWVTRLENVLNNPITTARIISICGSVEAFLNDPSLLRGHENIDPNFSWMRTVTPKEARVSLERLTAWAEKPTPHKGGSLGEWVFQEPISSISSDIQIRQQKIEPEEIESTKTFDETKSITPNAIQINWYTPSEFPCCPQNLAENPLKEYQAKLKTNALFCTNEKYSSSVITSALSDDNTSLFVITKSESNKPWALCKITFKNGIFIHENEGSFFQGKSVRKYFTLAQGKEWNGGDVFDDFC